MTDEQIKNWRELLCTAYGLGPYALMMPKEDIIKFRDKLQGRINKQTESIDDFFDKYTDEFDVSDEPRKGSCDCCKKPASFESGYMDVYDCTDLNKAKFSVCEDCLTMATGE